MKNLRLLVVALIVGIIAHVGQADEFNFQNIFSKVATTAQDQNILSQLEERLPKFLDINIPSNENVDKAFPKFKEALRLIPANIKRDSPLDATSARDLFPAIQPIYRYLKDTVWKSILKLIDLPKELRRIPAQNLAETNLNNLLSYSDEDTVSKVLELNSNRPDFSDDQKSILVQSYINKIKTKLNPANFQQLITQRLGASFLRYLPLDFLLNDSIFNDNSVIRNVATWLNLLSPLQRDAISNKGANIFSNLDAFGSIYRTDEISDLSDELMAELGRDEKTLEKLGAQDLTPNEARTIMNKIPRSIQNLWGKNMLGKLGNLIPGIDNTILKQILTRGRGDLPPLFNNTSPSFIRKLVPSKIRLLIDQYATEPNLAKYRQLLESDHAKKYIKSETLNQILHLAPDVLRLIRFTPAQASAAISNRLGLDKKFDGSLGNFGMISNFINGLTKSDIEKIKPEESLQAVQQAFGSSKTKNIDNQMQSNTRYAFGNLLRRGLQTSEATQKADDYVKGLFREDNLVDDLNPQLFSTMTNAELDAINRLGHDDANRFWNAVGTIRDPACCSFVNENRFRLADYALKYYGSATGDMDNFKLSQLGPFLVTSLRASDIRRVTTDALINKINFFKSNCFQPAKAEGQALGARLNDALGEVDDNLKALYLDLIGELAIYLPMDIAAPK
ncbi:unnamed protein product, partial [Rotaria magnacalcarata]